MKALVGLFAKDTLRACDCHAPMLTTLEELLEIFK